MTQAPDRERVQEHEYVVAPGVTRRPRSTPEAARPQRFDKAAWSKAVMVLNVALIGAVAIVGLTYIRNAEEPAAAGSEPPAQPSGVASTLASPDELAEPEAGVPVSTSPQSESAPTGEEAPAAEVPQAPSGGQVVAQAPNVKATMRSDFSDGDPWPVGAGFREAGSMAWPLGVVDRVMTHGAPEGPNAVSWLEKYLRSDVRTIGARVLFAPNHSGLAAMTAWHTSILDESGQSTPRTGMRLVVAPGQWRLVVLDGAGATTISSGTYAQQGRSATFSLVRKQETVWVTAPDGTVTSVTDPRVASLSGPWASWELREDSSGKRPAGFEEIWAG